MIFLTETERDFLLGRREFTRDQAYYTNSRLIKKIKAFYRTELPLLDEKGYLLAACRKNLAAGCKVLEERLDLVAQPGRALQEQNKDDAILRREREVRSLGRDSSPRPLPPWSIDTPPLGRQAIPYQGN
ncbi:MAG: hypothetical protein M3247_08975, partial [Thermoproteota archaeon]|nr:hypothetical protein [Thermoproteota archaeon]